MKYVVIERADFFKIPFEFELLKHGSLWCEGYMTDDNLQVLDFMGISYRVL